MRHLSLLAVVAVSVPALGLGGPFAHAAPDPSLRPPFAANSPFNVPIPAGAKVDPRSEAYVARLTAGNVVANTTDYANAIYEASAGTPRVPVEIPNDNRSGGSWGHNALYGQKVPVPAGAVPPAGTDGTVVVVDRARGKTYYFWQFRRTPTGIRSTWPSVFDLDGMGSAADPLRGRGTAAGISQLAGTVRIDELRRGRIDHALAFATDDSGCAAPGPGGTQNPNGEFRWPAVATDGSRQQSQDPNCLPYGMRVQLDPSIDVESLPGLSRGERILARALQKYGAYLVDRSGASMAVSFEKPDPGDPTYCELGLAPAKSYACEKPSDNANYWSLKHVVDGRLRVLADCACGTTRASRPVAWVAATAGATPTSTGTPVPSGSAGATPSPSPPPTSSAAALLPKGEMVVRDAPQPGAPDGRWLALVAVGLAVVTSFAWALWRQRSAATDRPARRARRPRPPRS